VSRDDLLVRLHSHNSGRERLPIDVFSANSAGNYNRSSPHLYSNPDGLDRLLRIFAVVKLEMSTITGPALSQLDKFEADAVIEARVCPEDCRPSLQNGYRALRPSVKKGTNPVDLENSIADDA
jgi:hypothetical protein